MLLGNVAAAIPDVAEHDEIGFGYTSLQGGKEDRLDVNFSLKADRQLEFQVCRPSGDDQYNTEDFQCAVLHKGVMHLSSSQEKELRTLLQLSRPSELSEDGPFLLPRGCDFVMHGSKVYAISFANQKNFGAFVVQQRTTCEGIDEAKNYIHAILTNLPDQSLIHKYPLHWDPAA